MNPRVRHGDHQEVLCRTDGVGVRRQAVEHLTRPHLEGMSPSSARPMTETIQHPTPPCLFPRVHPQHHNLTVGTSSVELAIKQRRVLAADALRLEFPALLAVLREGEDSPVVTGGVDVQEVVDHGLAGSGGTEASQAGSWFSLTRRGPKALLRHYVRLLTKYACPISLLHPVNLTLSRKWFGPSPSM